MSLVRASVWIRYLAISITLALLPGAVEDAAVAPRVGAFAMTDVFDERAFVDRSILPFHFALAVPLIVLPVALILPTIPISHHTSAILLIVSPVTCVLGVASAPLVRTSALHLVLLKLSVIAVPSVPFEFTATVLLVVVPVPNVDRAVRIFHLALARAPIILVLSLVIRTRWPGELALTMAAVCTPHTSVGASIAVGV